MWTEGVMHHWKHCANDTKKECTQITDHYAVAIYKPGEEVQWAMCPGIISAVRLLFIRHHIIVYCINDKCFTESFITDRTTKTAKHFHHKQKARYGTMDITKSS